MPSDSPTLPPGPAWQLWVGFVAYAVLMGLMVCLAFAPNPPEPLPAKLIRHTPVIVVGPMGPEGVTVQRVLKGWSGLEGRILPVEPSPTATDAEPKIRFLDCDLDAHMSGPRYRLVQDNNLGVPDDPFIRAQIRDVIEADK